MSETTETNEKLNEAKEQIHDLQKDNKQITSELREVEKRVTVVESYAKPELDEMQRSNQRLSDDLRGTEKKVLRIEIFAIAITVIAAVFGFTGAWGLKIFNDAKKHMDQLEQRIDVLQESANNVEKRVEDGIQKLQEEESQSIQDLEEATAERIKVLQQVSANYRIASGITPKGNTDWEPYKDYDSTISLWVDTSKAHFSSTPIYIPTLLGSGKHYEALGTNAVYDATENGFRLYIVFPDYSELTPTLANEYNWYVSWIGLELLPE